MDPNVSGLQKYVSGLSPDTLKSGICAEMRKEMLQYFCNPRYLKPAAD
jgi:hypothetical protein